MAEDVVELGLHHGHHLFHATDPGKVSKGRKGVVGTAEYLRTQLSVLCRACRQLGGHGYRAVPQCPRLRRRRGSDDVDI